MYFECIVGNGGAAGIPLTVTCDYVFAGLTITASDGTTTLTQQCPSTSPYTVEFKLPNDGVWTISGVISGQTLSEVITVLPYSTALHAIPDGETVTPTDDIQIWLNCAGIFDKNYTTISEVLADTTTLNALVQSANAVKYMVRSTTWASSVTADSSAMTIIGANDNCSDSLLADTTWSSAIIASTYMESILNTKIPTMTDNTTPSGVCNGSSVASSWTDYWRPFSGNDGYPGGYWAAGTSSAAASVGQYVYYEFPNEILAKKIEMKVANGAFYIDASPDNNSWTNLYTQASDAGIDAFTLFTAELPSNTTKYKYFRFRVKSFVATTHWPTVGMCQVYGRE